jgi:serine/threonine protein kinase
MVMGTAGYMSPEQVRGQATDQRSDIFSFGAILYEMLTGRRAFEGESMVELMHAILKDDVPELGDLDTRVPPSLDKLMSDALEKKPEHRFHSAHDLWFALDAVASPTSSAGSGLTVAASALRDTPDAGGRKWPGIAAWAAAAFIPDLDIGLRGDCISGGMHPETRQRCASRSLRRKKPRSMGRSLFRRMAKGSHSSRRARRLVIRRYGFGHLRLWMQDN